MSKSLTVLVCLAFFGAVRAQDVSSRVTVTPTVPVSGEPFVVAYSSFDSTCEEQNLSWSLDGRRLILDLGAEFTCGPNINPFLRPADFRFEIPGLPPGRYEIEIFYNAATQTFPPGSGGILSVAATVGLMSVSSRFLLVVILGILGACALSTKARR